MKTSHNLAQQSISTTRKPAPGVWHATAMLKTLSTALMVIAAGCGGIVENHPEFTPCSSGWYAQVEEKISTSDGQGHGPDPGSLEWRSTIEFKLGIRNSPAVPPLDTDQWCFYIQENFIKSL